MAFKAECLTDVQEVGAIGRVWVESRAPFQGTGSVPLGHSKEQHGGPVAGCTRLAAERLGWPDATGGGEGNGQGLWKVRESWLDRKVWVGDKENLALGGPGDQLGQEEGWRWPGGQGPQSRQPPSLSRERRGFCLHAFPAFL